MLLATRIAGTVHSPLYTESATDQAVPVPIPGTTYQHLGGSYDVHRLRLTTRDVGRLAAHSQIQFLVATYETKPGLENGDLNIVGTSCVYRTLRAATFPNNDLLTFVRSGDCVPLRGAPTGELRLTLRFTTPGRPALWTFVPQTGSALDDAAIVVADPRAPESPARPVVRGLLVDAYPANSARRVALLAYVWHITASGRWIWVGVATTTALLWLGILLLSGVEGCDRVSASTVVFGMAGGFCVAAALSVAYAFLVPPFQSADEPNHFIGFAAFIHRPNMNDEAAQFARIGHFERLQFRPAEHFGPADRGVLGVPWNDGGEPDSSARGAAVEWLWGAVPQRVRTLPAPRLLLALRLINAMIFPMAVAIFFGIMTGAGAGRWPELLAIPVLLVPTVPFFAMTVSNYGLLTSAYVLLAAGVVLDLRDRPGSEAAGAVIGAAWTGAALISRSALPLAPFIVAWVLGRLVVGHSERRWQSAFIYWVGFSAFVAVGLSVANTGYLRTMLALGQARLPAPIGFVLLAIATRPWLLLGFGACAAGAEFWVSSMLRTADSPRLRAAVTRSAVAAGLVILTMLAGSAVVRYPMLGSIGASPPPAVEYLKSVLAAGLTVFRFAHPDFLTSVSFWGGFGWLDTVPPPAFVSALAGASGLAFGGLLLMLASTGSVRPVIRIAFATFGFVCSMSSYAVSVVTVTPADLHGRYLLGLYLCMLAIGWTVVPMLVERRWLRPVGAVRAGCALAFVTSHVFALGVILSRYF